MTDNKEALYMLRGFLYSMPEDKRKIIEGMYSRICEIEKEDPELGRIALALRGAELAAMGE